MFLSLIFAVDLEAETHPSTLLRKSYVLGDQSHPLAQKEHWQALAIQMKDDQVLVLGGAKSGFDDHWDKFPTQRGGFQIDRHIILDGTPIFMTDNARYILADFNDPGKLQSLSRIFSGRFKYIIFDFSTSKFFNINTSCINAISHMLEPEGVFIVCVLTEEDGSSFNADVLAARQKGLLDLCALVFEHVVFDARYDVLSIRPKHPAEAEGSRYPVLLCSRPKLSSSL